MVGYGMTREEEIKREADWYEGNYKLLQQQCFIEGAKWADEHPYLSEEEQVGMGGIGMMWQKKHLIDKACSYLYAKSSMSGVEIDSFRKTMEE